MPLIRWSDALSVGVPAMDAQHRRLVELINELHEGMTRGAANSVLGDVLDQLVRYTTAHFASEERAMAAAGFPKLSEHKEEHRELTSEVAKLQQKFHAGKVGISIEVLRFLREWLEHHIQGSDREYQPWLAEKRAS